MFFILFFVSNNVFDHSFQKNPNNDRTKFVSIVFQFLFSLFFQECIFFSGMHWIKLGLEALKHARKPFPLLMRTDVWGQHLLALGPSRDIPSSSARDGDSIPFSMTWLSGFLQGLSQFPRSEMVLLLITVVLVPLVGKLGP